MIRLPERSAPLKNVARDNLEKRNKAKEPNTPQKPSPDKMIPKSLYKGLE